MWGCGDVEEGMVKRQNDGEVWGGAVVEREFFSSEKKGSALEQVVKEM